MKKNNHSLRRIILFPLCFLLSYNVFSFEINIELCPVIERFKRDDINFLQLQASIRQNDMLYFSQKETFPEFFIYTCGAKDKAEKELFFLKSDYFFSLRNFPVIFIKTISTGKTKRKIMRAGILSSIKTK